MSSTSTCPLTPIIAHIPTHHPVRRSLPITIMRTRSKTIASVSAHCFSSRRTEKRPDVELEMLKLTMARPPLPSPDLQHCVVTRVPVEVITEILKYTSVSQADLISVASTCRYLRAVSPLPPVPTLDHRSKRRADLVPYLSRSIQVASPFMFKDLSLVLEKVASFDPLQAIKTDPTKAKLVE